MLRILMQDIGELIALSLFLGMIAFFSMGFTGT